MALFGKNKYEQTPEKKKANEALKLKATLDGLIARGADQKGEWRTMRDEAIRYIYGDQHFGRNRKEGWEYPVINRAYPDLLQEVAMLTANNPSMAGLPREDSDIPTAKAVSEVLKGLWFTDLRMRAKIMQAILDDHTWGVKVATWYWEPRAQWDQELAEESGNGWRGAIRVDVIDPDTFGCDPELDLGLSLNERARFVYTDR